MDSGRCYSRVRRAPLIMVGTLAFLTMSLVAAAVHAQQSVFGQWWVDHTINTSGYLEPYRFLLTLYPNWDFNYTVQSLRFQRRTETVGTFSSLPAMGQNTYRFTVNRPQPNEMPAWTARMTLRSSSVMLYEDLTSGGKLQFRRVQ